jgi:hypothetical protein
LPPAHEAGGIDTWTEQSPANVERVAEAREAFGFDTGALAPNSFSKDNPVRTGHPPLRVKALTSASAANVSAGYERRGKEERGNVETAPTSSGDLKANKQASGRNKDLNDLNPLS